MTTAVQETHREPVENDESEYTGKRVPVEDEDLSDLMGHLTVKDNKAHINKNRQVDDISKKLGRIEITKAKPPGRSGENPKILKPFTSSSHQDGSYNSEEEADKNDTDEEDDVVVHGDEVRHSREGLISMGLPKGNSEFSTIDPTALHAHAGVKKRGRKPAEQTISLKHGAGGTYRTASSKAKTVAELLKEKREKEQQDALMKKLVENGQIELGPYNNQPQQQNPAYQQQVQLQLDAFLDQTDSLPSYDLDELQQNMPELMNLLVSDPVQDNEVSMEVTNQYTMNTPTHNQMDLSQTILPTQDNNGLFRNHQTQQYVGPVQHQGRPNSGSSDEGFSALSPSGSTESGYGTGTSPPRSPDDALYSAASPSPQNLNPEMDNDFNIIMDYIKNDEQQMDIAVHPKRPVSTEIREERALIQQHNLQSSGITHPARVSPPGMHIGNESLLPANTQCDPTLQFLSQSGIKEPPQAEFTTYTVPVNEPSITAPQNLSMPASPPLPASQLIPSSTPMPTSSPMVAPARNISACSLQSQVPQTMETSRSPKSSGYFAMSPQAHSPKVPSPRGQISQAHSPQMHCAPQEPSPQSQVVQAHSSPMHYAQSPPVPSPQGQIAQTPLPPMHYAQSPQVPSPQSEIAQAHSPPMQLAPSSQAPSPQGPTARAHSPQMQFASSPQAPSPQGQIAQAPPPQMQVQNIPTVEDNIPSLIPKTCQMAATQQSGVVQGQVQANYRPQAPTIRNTTTSFRKILPRPDSNGMPPSVPPASAYQLNQAVIPGVVLAEQVTIAQPGKPSRKFSYLYYPILVVSPFLSQIILYHMQ